MGTPAGDRGVDLSNCQENMSKKNRFIDLFMASVYTVGGSSNMSTKVDSIDIIPTCVDSTDNIRRYVDIWRLFRHVRSIGRLARQIREPGTET